MVSPKRLDLRELKQKLDIMPSVIDAGLTQTTRLERTETRRGPALPGRAGRGLTQTTRLERTETALRLALRLTLAMSHPNDST